MATSSSVLYTKKLMKRQLTTYLQVLLVQTSQHDLQHVEFASQPFDKLWTTEKWIKYIPIIHINQTI